jgi:hypothetical protein
MIVFIDSRQPCVDIICYGNLVDLFLETNLSFGILPISVKITLFQGVQVPRLALPPGDAHDVIVNCAVYIRDIILLDERPIFFEFFFDG